MTRLIQKGKKREIAKKNTASQSISKKLFSQKPTGKQKIQTSQKSTSKNGFAKHQNGSKKGNKRPQKNGKTQISVDQKSKSKAQQKDKTNGHRENSVKQYNQRGADGYNGNTMIQQYYGSYSNYTYSQYSSYYYGNYSYYAYSLYPNQFQRSYSYLYYHYPSSYDKWAADFKKTLAKHTETSLKSLGQVFVRAYNEHRKHSCNNKRESSKMNGNGNSQSQEKLRVLDVGCGTGRMVEVLVRSLGKPKDHQEIFEFDGLDYNKGMLSIAREKNIYRKLFQANLKSKLNEVEDRQYDAIVSSGVFLDGHVETEAIPELSRKLKPGGFMCFIVWPNFYQKTQAQWERVFLKSGLDHQKTDMLPCQNIALESFPLHAPMITCIKQAHVKNER